MGKRGRGTIAAMHAVEANLDSVLGVLDSRLASFGSRSGEFKLDEQVEAVADTLPKVERAIARQQTVASKGKTAHMRRDAKRRLKELEFQRLSLRVGPYLRGGVIPHDPEVVDDCYEYALIARRRLKALERECLARMVELGMPLPAPEKRLGIPPEEPRVVDPVGLYERIKDRVGLEDFLSCCTISVKAVRKLTGLSRKEFDNKFGKFIVRGPSETIIVRKKVEQTKSA